ncbi:photosynthetic reaction center cytochrome c subunit [Methylocystis hirsuta]|uniref:Photosynthetic reaction center cytochrome c subunit n=1 Tax=Methylocystis hirsuta TaxID=369798 RepID=A0A3M9XLT8_9HYPH|nr:photosynthetic reaction center cytochrome c subunit [Methylocystis hirsuta]
MFKRCARPSSQRGRRQSRTVDRSAWPARPGAGLPGVAIAVNCTFCHNNRTFLDWSQSASQHATALNGLQMMREVNAVYLEALKLLYPANRLGPLRDSPKAN